MQVEGDDTPALDSVLKSDIKRNALLEEAAKLEAELDQGDDGKKDESQDEDAKRRNAELQEQLNKCYEELKKFVHRLIVLVLIFIPSFVYSLMFHRCTLVSTFCRLLYRYSNHRLLYLHIHSISHPLIVLDRRRHRLVLLRFSLVCSSRLRCSNAPQRCQCLRLTGVHLRLVTLTVPTSIGFQWWMEDAHLSGASPVPPGIHT